ncbi:hypothetical protein GCM10027074_51880 [Streptomyces deserti]
MGRLYMTTANDVVAYDLAAEGEAGNGTWSRSAPTSVGRGPHQPPDHRIRRGWYPE